jgi:hypothetical protein
MTRHVDPEGVEHQSDPYRVDSVVVCEVPVALPPAIKLVRFANVPDVQGWTGATGICQRTLAPSPIGRGLG